MGWQPTSRRQIWPDKQNHLARSPFTNCNCVVRLRVRIILCIFTLSNFLVLHTYEEPLESFQSMHKMILKQHTQRSPKDYAPDGPIPNEQCQI